MKDIALFICGSLMEDVLLRSHQETIDDKLIIVICAVEVVIGLLCVLFFTEEGRMRLEKITSRCRKSNVSKMKKMGDVQGLVRVLKQDGAETDIIVEALGDIGDPFSVQPIMESIRPNSSGITQLEALIKIGKPAVDEITSYLFDSIQIRR